VQYRIVMITRDYGFARWEGKKKSFDLGKRSHPRSPTNREKTTGLRIRGQPMGLGLVINETVVKRNVRTFYRRVGA